jgi:hypothetical protein
MDDSQMEMDVVLTLWRLGPGQRHLTSRSF